MAKTYKFGNGTWATKKGSTLAYSDTNNAFKPLPFSFERNSIGTRVNKEGLIEVVGNDIPRIDYTDSTEGALKLEPQRTNLVTYSEDFSNASWIKNNCTITSDNSVSPDGTQNADKLDFTTSNGEIVRTTSFVSGQEYTMSFYAKTESGTLNFDYGNISANTINGNATTEWKRFEVTQTSTSGTRYPKIQTTEIGSLLLWGFQLEQGSYASSYIPTNGSTVQRAAETCNGSGNSEVFNDSQGVVFANISGFVDSDDYRIISLNGGNSTDSIFLGLRNDTGNVYMYMPTDSTSYISNVNATNKFTKIALKYKTNDVSFFINGFKVFTDNSVTLPTGLNQLDLNYGNPTGSYPFYGKTKEIGYYDEILTDAELEKLTSYRSLNEMVTELNLNAL